MLSTTTGCGRAFARGTRPCKTRGRQAVAWGLAVVLANVAAAPPAHAEFKIRYPNIDYREIEIENNTSVTFDKRKGGNSRQNYFLHNSFN